MKRNLPKGPFIFVIAIAAFTGCVSFDSVTTTGKIGAKISDYTSVLDSDPTICRYYVAIGNAEYNDETCKTVFDDVRQIKDAMLVLSAYGEQLQTVAKSSDTKVEDQVSTALTALNDSKFTTISESKVKGAAKVSQSLFSFITDGMRRKVLKSSITVIDQDVYDACQSLSGYIQLSITERELFLTQVQTKLDLDLDYGVSEIARQLLDFSTEELIYELKLDTAKLHEADKALVAFGESHQKLAKEIDKVGGSKDYEVAKDIAKGLFEIYGGIKESIEEE